MRGLMILPEIEFLLVDERYKQSYFYKQVGNVIFVFCCDLKISKALFVLERLTFCWKISFPPSSLSNSNNAPRIILMVNWEVILRKILNFIVLLTSAI